MPASNKETTFDYIIKGVMVVFIGWLSLTVHTMSVNLESIKAKFEEKTDHIEDTVDDHESRIRILEMK